MWYDVVVVVVVVALFIPSRLVSSLLFSSRLVFECKAEMNSTDINYLSPFSLRLLSEIVISRNKERWKLQRRKSARYVLTNCMTRQAYNWFKLDCNNTRASLVEYPALSEFLVFILRIKGSTMGCVSNQCIMENAYKKIG